MREKLRKRTGLLAVTGVIMLVCAFFITGTVMSQTRDRVKVDEKYYVLLEEEYPKQVREILKQEGYSNCGLTLTYTKEVGGERRYHLRIHNQRFDRLNDIEKKAILNRVGKVDFGVEGCSLYQEYN